MVDVMNRQDIQVQVKYDYNNGEPDIIPLMECRYNTHITEVVLPEGLLEVPERAFCGCRNLKSIIIPVSVRYIGTGAFKGCLSLTELHVPAGLLHRIIK